MTRSTAHRNRQQVLDAAIFNQILQVDVRYAGESFL